MKKIEKAYYCIKAETKNELYAKGYRYFCDCDYQITGGMDLDGMPHTTQNTAFFFEDEKEEAEGFAKKQIWVFNKDITAKVFKLPEHVETTEEYTERIIREKEERKAKKIAKEQAKANALGMTVEEYKAEVKRQKKIREVKEEIEALNKRLAEAKEELKKLENK